MKRGNRRNRGFALVVTVVLLSLLVLVLVMVASLARIETSVSGNTRKFAQARQNALFGLERAMSQLQFEAGPDQRITATAEMALANPPQDRQKWTAVWDSAGGGPRSWLVSGGPDPANQPLSADNVPIVTGQSATPPFVAVQSEDIRGTAPDGAQNVLLGRFAYWVGDEGVKARVNFFDPIPNMIVGLDNEDPELDEKTNLLLRSRHQVPHRTGTERVTGFSALSFADPVSAQFETDLARVLATPQMAYVGPSPPTLGAIRDRFHDITAHSRGVLANVVDGGLKRDLTPFFIHGDAAGGPALGDLVGPSGPTFGLLRSWWELSGGSSSPTLMVDAREYDAGPPEQFGIYPVLTRFSLFFETSYFINAGGENELRLHVMPIFTLWNPYSVGITGTYYFKINFPAQFNFTVDGSAVAGVFSLADAGADPLEMVVTDLEIRGGDCRIVTARDWALYDPANPENNILAGKWIGEETQVPAGDPPPEGPRTAFYFDTLLTFPEGGGPPHTVIMDQFEPLEGFLPVVAVHLGTSDSDPELQLLDTELVDYVPLLSDVHEMNDTTDEDLGPPLFFDPEIIAHLWFMEKTNEGAEEWAKFPLTWTGAGEGVPTDEWVGADWELVVVPGWQEYPRGHTGADWQRPVPGVPGGQPRNLFFENPRADVPLFSIGKLQNVHARGNTWRPSYFFQEPGVSNELLWDASFLSGIPDDLTEAELDDINHRFPFSRLRPLWRDGEAPPVEDIRFGPGGGDPVERVAGHTMVDGAFNVNSTSLEAWRAVLWSLADVPVQWDEPQDFSDPFNPVDRNEPVGNRHPLSRFGFPLVESLDSGSDPYHSAEAWRGYRRLTNAQVDDLALEIRDRVEARGQPFRSLTEFVNSGILQDAIVAAALNPAWVEIPDWQAQPDTVPIPGQLTQWDVLSVLAPILTVRSDTFLIRAYGETINPVTNLPEGQAWCEAVVQRMPDYFDDSGDDNEPWDPPSGDNLTYGRTFEIISFRWLTLDDI